MSARKNLVSIKLAFVATTVNALAILICVAPCGATPTAWYDASQPGFSSGLGTGASNWSIGEDFTVGSQPIEITALGFYDFNGHSLATSHEVKLYSLTNSSTDLTGTLLATVTVPAGTGALLEDGTRFVNLTTPILLPAGTLASVVGYGFSAADPYGCCGGPLPTSGNLVWVGADRYDTSGLGPTGLPPFHASDANNHAGGNFLFVNTPEPSTFILGGLGLVGLSVAARRRKA